MRLVLKSKIKNIILTLVVFAMILQCAAVTAFAAPNKNDVIEEYSAKIMNVKGGATAIATMTFDDGTRATSNALLPIMQEYNFKASLMVVASRVESGGSYANAEQLKELINGGYLEVQSHSYSHMYIAPVGHADYKEGNNTPENIEREVAGSYTYLTGKFQGTDFLSFAVPGNSYNSDAMAKVQEIYYAARFNYTPSTTNRQTLNPTEDVNAGGWYNLKNIWIKDSNVDTVNAYLDACVENGGWFITAAHELVDGGNHSIYPDNYKLILDNMKEHEEAGKLWVATFSEAVKYLREYQNSTVYQYLNTDGMFVEVSLNEKTASGKALDSAVFDMPLTVKVEIPEGWERVRFRQNGEETYANSFTDGGKCYAYVDIVPGSGKVSVSDADKEIPRNYLNASLPLAPRGTKAIASLTFDDGLMNTAKNLNYLFAKYDLCGSLMMITDNVGVTYSVERWNELFKDGYLQPESHSYSHDKITSSTPDTNTPENIEEEVVLSRDTLNKLFSYHNVLTYAIPYSSYTKEAYQAVMENYYAARGGECVLIASYGNSGKMQSLDPASGTSRGSWYNPYIARLATYSTNGELTTTAIKNYLTQCIRNNGWFIGMAHGIVEGENMDITSDDLSVVLAAMQKHVNNGDLWVATYSDATKYIRERQNSTVKAYTTFDGMYVDLTMSDYTTDGLPLPNDVFNMPITVKIEMPDKWGRITYQQPGGELQTAYCFKEDGLNYVLIDLVPNGGTATIKNDGDPTDYLSSIGMKQNVSEAESLSYNLYIPSNSEITGVYVGRNALSAIPDDGGYTKYSVGSVNVKEIDKEFTVTLKFTEKSGYIDWDITVSVLSYFKDLLDSDGVTDKDKQLAFDFLSFAKATRERFLTKPDNAQINELLSKLQGFSASVRTLSPADIGTATNALTGASFAVNEKPYYVFYIKESFTGTVTLSYEGMDGAVEESFEVVNGYYHCKRFLVFDVKYTYDIIAEITIKAEGTVLDEAVSAEGKYSLDNYLSALKDDNNSSYAEKLYSYALSAHEYMN